MWAHVLHCALENGADLYVNERQKIRHYSARSTEERRMPSRYFLLARGARAYVNLRYIAYTYMVIHSFYWKSAVDHDGGV